MSDYCCGVKQANKQCVWLCNGSIQTFLCVCEAPARSSVWLLNKENLCLTSSPMPGCQRSLGHSGLPNESGRPAHRQTHRLMMTNSECTRMSGSDYWHSICFAFLILVTHFVFSLLLACNSVCHCRDIQLGSIK